MTREHHNAFALWVRFAVVAGAAALAGPQGVSADPPRITNVVSLANNVERPLGEWIVSGAALEMVRLTFDSPVILLPGSVVAGKLVPDSTGLAAVPVGVVVGPLPATPVTTLDVTFAPQEATRLTLVVDYTIVNAAGEALDGEVEVDDTGAMTRPTGDGLEGGQAVFQFNVLQGDANRDGKVNAIDSALVTRAIDNGAYDPLLDLNADGVVDLGDAAIVQAGLGSLIPPTDKTPPVVESVVPGSSSPAGDELVVRFGEAMDPDTITRTTVYGLGDDGVLITAAQDPTIVDERTFVFLFDGSAPFQAYAVTVSNAAGDATGERMESKACGTFAFDVAGFEIVPPLLTCPQAGFVNSTRLLSIVAEDLNHNLLVEIPAIKVFRDAAVLTGGCNVDITTSLDQAVDLPLGVTNVTFTANDVNHTLSCETALIVVPAVALQCWDLNEDGEEDPAEDTNGDGLFNVDDCQGPPGDTGPSGTAGVPGSPGSAGSPGPAGFQGLDCWDLDEDGVKDPSEDTNGDGLVNVADCRGPQGNQGDLGLQGRHCWDLDGDGVADLPEEDTNGDGLVNVADCQGLQGTQGDPGIEGHPCWDLDGDGEPDLPEEDTNADGVVDVLDCQGAPGETAAPQEVPAEDGAQAPETRRRLCGALGMVTIMLMLCPLSALRAWRRRSVF